MKIKTITTAITLALVSSMLAFPLSSQAATQIDASQSELDFDNGVQNVGGTLSALLDQRSDPPKDDIGEGISVGDFIDYYNVITVGGTQVDARVTFTAQLDQESSLGLADGKIDKLDDYTSTTADNRHIRTDLTYDSGLGEGYVEYEVEFFENLATTPSPVELQNFILSIYDIDSYQYVETSEFDRYYLAAGSILSLSSPRQGITRFAETAGISTSSSDPVADYMKSRLTVEFDATSSFVLRLGQNVPGNTPESAASYSLDFGLGLNWGGSQQAAVVPPVYVAPVVPYTGPLLQDFSSRTLDPCTPKSITITGTRLSGITASIQGKSVTVLENTDTKLVLAFPAGLTPGSGVNLDINSSSGNLTFQNAFDIPANTCSLELSKGRWTQLQSDGKTAKMYAKDPVGDGKIQFFVDGKEIAWINAVDLTDPKLSFASSNPYLVRSVTLNPGKNRFEIKLDGVRVWRATYVPKG